MKLGITTLDDDGAGWGEHAGERVRVVGAFPGDEVEAVPFHFARQRRFHDARLVRVLTPSPARGAVPCPIWRSECACPLMPLAPAAQAAFKHARVQAAFPGVAVEPVRQAALREHYRSKVILVCDNQRFGGYARGTHDVLDLHGCVIEAPLLGQIAEWLRAAKIPAGGLRYVAMRANENEALVTLIGRTPAPAWAMALAGQLRRDIPAVRGVSWSINDSPGNAIWVAPAAPLAGAQTIEEDIGGMRVRLSPSSFFQVHRAQAAALRTELLAALSGAQTAWDLFCGIGVNALLLAAQECRAIGVEAHVAATQDATDNAARLRLDARFVTGSLDVPDVLAALPAPDVVVLNPPRKGASPALLEAVIAARPQRIAYVACMPAPLAAAAELMYKNGYIASRVIPFDLFPHTSHIETIALFSRV